MRTEFGAERSTCACEECKEHCRIMPGFLIPADLQRMMPTSGFIDWAEANLMASPGAVVKRGELVFRIPTLVPAKRPDGSCINLSPDGLCQIHDAAPFGCAFFGCKSGTESHALSRAGLTAVWEDFCNNGIYSLLWYHLNAMGKIQDGPEVLRELYKVNP